MKLLLVFVLFLGASELAGAQTAEPRYRINTDYDQPRSKETFLYAVFMLDHDKWPNATKIAISRFGFVFVSERVAERRYRITPFYVAPHELQRFAILLHDEVRFTSIESRSKSKHDPYLLYMTAAYSQPSLSHHVHSVYSDAADAIRPLMTALRQWQRNARDVWAAPVQPGKGPPTVGTLETDDIEFLEHMMDILHYTSTWRPQK